jgi:nucleoside-diphosphate-sugar epimerase
MIASPSPEPPLRLPCPAEQIDHFLSAPSQTVVEAISRHRGPMLILGAGGKLGLHLSIMAAEAFRQLGWGEQVTAVSRFGSLRDQQEFARFGIATLACDLEDEEQLARLPDASTVIFLAGVKFGTSAAPELLQRLNVEMPRKVAERFRASRIVAFSTGCVYPFVSPESGGATEQTLPAPIGAYADSCLQRERAFEEASRRHGTTVALIRLNYAVEFRYGVLIDIAEKVLAGVPIDVTTGYVNAIWQRDAVAHSLQALDIAAAPAIPLNITGVDILSVRQVAESFGRIFGVPVRIAGTEEATAWLSNAGKSHRLFGLPATSVADMIGWTAAWLREGGSTWGKATGFEKRGGAF